MPAPRKKPVLGARPRSPPVPRRSTGEQGHAIFSAQPVRFSEPIWKSVFPAVRFRNSLVHPHKVRSAAFLRPSSLKTVRRRVRHVRQPSALPAPADHVAQPGAPSSCTIPVVSAARAPIGMLRYLLG